MRQIPGSKTAVVNNVKFMKIHLEARCLVEMNIKTKEL